MVQTEEAIVRFGKLFEQECLWDLSWAEELQKRMCQKGLMLSGRSISTTIRLEVLSRMQYEKLTKTADHLSAILEQVEPSVLRTPALLNRLGMLPVEKMLTGVKVKNTSIHALASMKAHRNWWSGPLMICRIRS